MYYTYMRIREACFGNMTDCELHFLYTYLRSLLTNCAYCMYAVHHDFAHPYTYNCAQNIHSLYDYIHIHTPRIDDYGEKIHVYSFFIHCGSLKDT
jgi:hypothetical protein